MRLAVCIPTKHRHAELMLSMQTVLPMAQRAGAMVLICDQSPETFIHDGVTVLHRPDLPGLPAARNALLAATDAEVLLFLDDDTDVAPDLGERLLELAAREPQVAAWGPVLEMRSAWWRRAYRVSQFGCLRDPRRLTRQVCDQPTNALFGCCFAVRRQAALAVGGFDARLPGYALGEDLDCFRRLAAAGFRLRFASSLRATHRGVGGQRPGMWQTLRFLRWFASRHGRGNPATLLHVLLAAGAALVRRAV